MKTKYYIRCWMPVDESENEAIDTLEEAKAELEHCQLMQPENRYEIEEE